MESWLSMAAARRGGLKSEILRVNCILTAIKRKKIIAAHAVVVLSAQRACRHNWREGTLQSAFMDAKQTNRAFCGSMVAVVTPMRADGGVDIPTLQTLLDWHIEQGSAGIVIAGTTGESPTLTVQEHQELIAKAVEIVGGRTAVVAGVGANSTQEAISLTRRAHADGADAGLSVVPYYNKPTQEGLYRHFAAIAESCDLPLLLYDVPGRVVTALADETVARLAQVANIVGIKDAVGDVARVARLRAAAGEDFAQLSGDDKTSCEYLLAGGDGVISVTANVAPKNMWQMVDAARRGDAARAQEIDARMQAFHTAQGVESNPIPVKAALAMMGKISAGIRLPLTPLSAAHRDAVHRAASEAAAQ